MDPCTYYVVHANKSQVIIDASIHAMYTYLCACVHARTSLSMHITTCIKHGFQYINYTLYMYNVYVHVVVPGQGLSI